MPDNPTHRIRQLLQTARSSVGSLISTLDSLEEELRDLEQEEQAIDYESLGGQDPEITYTQEETEVMLLKMLLNIDEAAFLLGVKPAEVHKLINEGKLPVCKLTPRTVRIPVKQLKEHIEADKIINSGTGIKNGIKKLISSEKID